MTDSDFENVIAANPLVNKAAEDIRAQVNALKKMAIMEIRAEVPDFWGRVTDSFTLPANTEEIDMLDYFDNYDYVKYLWTDEQMLEEKTEPEFITEYPDGIQQTGKPTIYIPKGGKLIKFAPYNTVATTINITYMTLSNNDSLSEIPERWHHVPLYHVLSFYDKPEVLRYSAKYRDALKTMKNLAKESENQEIKLILGSFYSTISAIQANHRSR